MFLAQWLAHSWCSASFWNWMSEWVNTWMDEWMYEWNTLIETLNILKPCLHSPYCMGQDWNNLADESEPKLASFISVVHFFIPQSSVIFLFCFSIYPRAIFYLGDNFHWYSTSILRTDKVFLGPVSSSLRKDLFVFLSNWRHSKIFLAVWHRVRKYY